MNRLTAMHRWPGVVAIREVVGATYESWRQDRTLRLGAGLAYYSLFTIVPFIALIAALAEQVFGLVDMAGYFADRLAQTGIVDPEVAGRSIAAELDRRSVKSTLGVIGAGSLLFASSLVFLALVDAINTIWDVPVRSGLRNSVRRRLVSFLMVLVTGVVLIAALAVSTVSSAVERIVPGSLEIGGTVSALIGWVASASTLAIALTLLFRYVGPVRAPWRPTALSAVATSFLMVVGAQAISWYLTNFGGSSLGGAFGAVLLLLSWVYYEAQILLGGVQLVKVLSRRRGLSIGTDPLLPEH
jgi:membrane protein